MDKKYAWMKQVTVLAIVLVVVLGAVCVVLAARPLKS
jgi:hypothetical protein